MAVKNKNTAHNIMYEIIAAQGQRTNRTYDSYINVVGSNRSPDNLVTKRADLLTRFPTGTSEQLLDNLDFEKINVGQLKNKAADPSHF